MHWRPRLLGLQMLLLLTYPIKTIPWLFSKRYKAIEIPTRGRHTLRATIFEPPQRSSKHLRPLHLNFHSGAFVGGIADAHADWCSLLSDKTGSVVISADYRLAPWNLFPCAHEDGEDVVDWIIKHSRDFWNADPSTLTVSGFSAGCNIMFTAGNRARAAVGFYAPVDLRLPPWEKPKSEHFPKSDPMAFLLPLYDAYAGAKRDETMNDSRLHPILKPFDEVPNNILFIVPLIDILVKEQLAFIERLNHQLAAQSKASSRRFETITFEKAFHGWLECELI